MYSITLSQSSSFCVDNQEKLKEGGTPKKELNGVIVAADENGMPHLNGFRENGLSGHNHVDLEAGTFQSKLLQICLTGHITWKRNFKLAEWAAEFSP